MSSGCAKMSRRPLGLCPGRLDRGDCKEQWSLLSGGDQWGSRTSFPEEVILELNQDEQLSS